MKYQRATVLFVAAVLFSALPVLAQQKRISPHETISAVFSGNRVTLVYGRPYSKDPKTGETRKIWGTLVPYGKVWRTGSDEATLLITQKPIKIGETAVPAGAYTLFTALDDQGNAKLVISKQLGQWGLQYDEKQDFARVDMKKEAMDKSLDQFTMALDKSATGGVIKLMWENTQYSVGFTNQK